MPLTYSIGTPLPKDKIEFKVYGDPSIPELKENPENRKLLCRELAEGIVTAVKTIFPSVYCVDDAARKCYMLRDGKNDVAYVRYE